MNVNLSKFYYASSCTYCGRSEIKCTVSGVKRLMLSCVWKWHTAYIKPYAKPIPYSKKKKSKHEINTNLLQKPCHFCILLASKWVWAPLFWLLFHGTGTRALHTASKALYQVHYQASLLYHKSHTYGAGYVMQMSKCISLPILHYGWKCF